MFTASTADTLPTNQYKSNLKPATIHSPKNEYFSIPSNIDGSPSSYRTFNSTDLNETCILDIRFIDHEAIKNDRELKELSKNPGAFNEVQTKEYDSDEDTYAEVEYLTRHPEEECRIRELLNELDEYISKPTSKLSSVVTDVKKSKPNAADIEDLEYSDQKSFTQTALNFFTFVSFIIYRIYTKVFIPLFLYPISFTWIIFRNVNIILMPDQKIRRSVNSIIALIILNFVCSNIRNITTNYFNSMLGYLNKQQQLQQYQQSSYVLQINKNDDQIVSDFTLLLTTTGGSNSHDLKSFWRKINQSHYGIEEIKESIDEYILAAIESKLPEMIFVNTDIQGDLIFPSEYFAHLKDLTFWDKFLKQNEEFVKSYSAGEMDQIYTIEQKTKSMLVGKENFLRMLLIALFGKFGNTSQDIPQSFNSLIENAIQAHHNEIIKSPDFALGSRGAKIIYDLTSLSNPHVSFFQRYYRFYTGFGAPPNGPQMAIMVNTQIGECWQMAGNSGSLGIELSQPISIKAITVEYPSAQVMNDDMMNAPKDFEVYCSINYDGPDLRYFLGSFTYDISKNKIIQTFEIKPSALAFCKTVVVKFRSNWGSLERTDIYRIRIHGTFL